MLTVIRLKSLSLGRKIGMLSAPNPQSSNESGIAEMQRSGSIRLPLTDAHIHHELYLSIENETMHTVFWLIK